MHIFTFCRNQINLLYPFRFFIITCLFFKHSYILLQQNSVLFLGLKPIFILMYETVCYIFHIFSTNVKINATTVVRTKGHAAKMASWALMSTSFTATVMNVIRLLIKYCPRSHVLLRELDNRPKCSIAR